MCVELHLNEIRRWLIATLFVLDVEVRCETHDENEGTVVDEEQDPCAVEPGQGSTNDGV